MTEQRLPELTVPARFNGPPQSANGGWFAGSVAALVAEAERLGSDEAVRVRLLSPPPLERPLSLRRESGGYSVADGEIAVASAIVATGFDPAHLPAIAFADAEAAGQAYEGLAEHPFSTCFSCGTARSDGLGLRPGAVPGTGGTYAAAWVAAETGIPIAWAALDCPGGWSAGIAGRPMVLGTMTAAVRRLPQVGERCVIVARPTGGEGRRFTSATALLGADGEVLGQAEAVWISVDPAAVRPA